MPLIHVAPVASIDPVVLYRLMRLRVDVFVVEQRCAYPELDGRDLEPGAVLLWMEEDGEPVATLRLLAEGEDRRIGRVVTAERARGRGLAARLIRRAIELSDGRAIRLDAQSHLAGWYADFGFSTAGSEFVEDGIPHVPMLRARESTRQAQAS